MRRFLVPFCARALDCHLPSIAETFPLLSGKVELLPRSEATLPLLLPMEADPRISVSRVGFPSLPPSDIVLRSGSSGPMLLEIRTDPPAPLRASSFSNEITKDSEPFLYGASSYTGNGPINLKGDPISGEAFTSKVYTRRQSHHQNCRGEATETFLITRLFISLLSTIGAGYGWVKRFLALGCYAVLLMPGFIQVGYYYYSSKQVRRGITYGAQPRNKLDLYFPKNNTAGGLRPMVAFITGGAWTIGYKAWGSLLGLQLSERGIIVACIDYRNFPQGTIRDMVSDASTGISFICNNCAEYGGDPDRIFVMGQSAGAHIAACALLEQAMRETGEADKTSPWSLSQIRSYFGLSGGYNLVDLADHFHSRGLHRSIFFRIMEGENSLAEFSPELVARHPNFQPAAALLPSFVLFHGTADYSIPCHASTNFVDALERMGVKAEAIMYEGKTHTDLFVQDPMRGGDHDDDGMLRDLVSLVYSPHDPPPLFFPMRRRRRLVPEFLIRLARAEQL